MDADQLDAWRSRPMEVRVFSECPRCKKLEQGVEKRTFQVNWWLKKTETCCAACVPEVEAGLKNEVTMG
jgi:hypothetical protein